MKILFLGDVIGVTGRSMIFNNLPEQRSKKKKLTSLLLTEKMRLINGVGITENICTNDLISSGVDVITTGNHVWDQKETM